MTAKTFGMPVTGWATAVGGGRIAILPDGRRVPVEEWKQMRVTPGEFYRLMGLKSQQDPGDWDPITQTYTDPTPEEPSWV